MQIVHMLSFSSTIIQTVYPIINFTIKTSWGLQGAAAKTRGTHSLAFTHTHAHTHKQLILPHTIYHTFTHID